MALRSLLTLLLLVGACTDDGSGSEDVTGNGEQPEFPTVTEVEVQRNPRRRPGIIHAKYIHGVSVDSDEMRMTVHYGSGTPSCYRLDRVEVSYEPDSLVVTPYEWRLHPVDPNPRDDVHVACVGIAIEKEVTFSLSQPLAGRQVVDGACLARRGQYDLCNETLFPPWSPLS